MFQTFLEGILKLKEGHWFWRAIMFLTRPAVIGGVLLTMWYYTIQFVIEAKQFVNFFIYYQRNCLSTEIKIKGTHCYG